MEKKYGTSIRISQKNKKRLRSILKYGEALDFAITLVLWTYQKPKLDRGQNIFRNRTLSPLITDAEEAQIIETMKKSVGD